MMRWLCLVAIMWLSAHDFAQLLRYASYVGHVSGTFDVSHICCTSYVSCVNSMRCMGFVSHAGGVL